MSSPIQDEAQLKDVLRQLAAGGTSFSEESPIIPLQLDDIEDSIAGASFVSTLRRTFPSLTRAFAWQANRVRTLSQMTESITRALQFFAGGKLVEKVVEGVMASSVFQAKVEELVVAGVKRARESDEEGHDEVKRTKRNIPK